MTTKIKNTNSKFATNINFAYCYKKDEWLAANLTQK